ncbi:P-II family nitrogen regulator [Aquabacterium sp. J223]|uniref:P-II family nitrogen regulator n=1 Tax=Aquabacterium sp. J223 TaxID=2898431 RepID=UPI0021AD8CF2|nr:P-II family nitrogen regulator [Aquabacterium sp. J223]UUX94959.1 P-II family nitrogen regulator [Aquabacterium sp. J223]
MKEIKAVMAPQRLPGLHAALRAQPGFPGMTVLRAEGYVGAVSGGAVSIRDALRDHVPRVRVEMVVSDEVAERLYDCVVASVSSGQPGDSAVWMTDVDRAAFVHKTV